jgi:broad specificity phosphatase PhoE
MNAIECNLYRHGHTPANDRPEVVMGQSLGAPLDGLGLAQAIALGNYLVDNELIPDLVFSSHAERALSTARTAVGVLRVSGKFSRNVAVMTDQRLTEQSLGEHEGMPRVEVYTSEILEQIDRERADYRHPRGESMRDVSARGYAALLDGVRFAEKTSVARVDNYTHNMTIAAILARIEGAVKPDEMHDYIRSMTLAKRIGNVSRTMVVWEKDRFRVELVGEPTVTVA